MANQPELWSLSNGTGGEPFLVTVIQFFPPVPPEPRGSGRRARPRRYFRLRTWGNYLVRSNRNVVQGQRPPALPGRGMALPFPAPLRATGTWRAPLEDAVHTQSGWRGVAIVRGHVGRGEFIPVCPVRFWGLFVDRVLRGSLTQQEPRVVCFAVFPWARMGQASVRFHGHMEIGPDTSIWAYISQHNMCPGCHQAESISNPAPRCYPCGHTLCEGCAARRHGPITRRHLRERGQGVPHLPPCMLCGEMVLAETPTCGHALVFLCLLRTVPHLDPRLVLAGGDEESSSDDE